MNLTAAEQGEAAGPFIGFTILVVLVIVGITFRSYWVLAVTGAALAALIVWLKGISNLIGLEDDLVLSLIVPIAMISFGVDFAFHSVGRYREVRQDGQPPKVAFTLGLAAVPARWSWPWRPTAPPFCRTRRPASNRSFSSGWEQRSL